MLVKGINQNPFPGEGFQQGPTLPWYASQWSNNPKLAGRAPAAELLESWPEIGFGNAFEYVYLDISGESAATLSAGCLLTFSLPATDTVSASLTDTASGHIYGVTLGGTYVAGAEKGNIIYFQDLGLSRVIEDNTAHNIIFSLKGTTFGNNQLDPNYLLVAPGNSTNVSITRPGHVVVNATPGPPTHVVLNDVVEGQRIVAQRAGYALIIGNNSGGALVAGTPAIAAANGIIEGGTAPSATQGDALIIPLHAYDGANTLIPCWFKGCGYR